ncbi:hypothetical protein CY34DRAFT_19898 [Suillus luteus UH-Slu-Lm8-n1]|uniref:Uncharacterized protein n=1 Tax=Suillus luteus UH-Slu-Lm8-n1 TaxID=930992 RepID=A0A0C9Z1U9_9AGAM|nr:hypothetical protein CY34DRAFT_19898 [Suillus luteus UH-Slu-Lm8-n1]
MPKVHGPSRRISQDSLIAKQRIPLRSSLYGADIWMTRHISHPLRTDSTGRETHATCDKPEIGKGGF